MSVEEQVVPKLGAGALCLVVCLRVVLIILALVNIEPFHRFAPEGASKLRVPASSADLQRLRNCRA